MKYIISNVGAFFAALNPSIDKKFIQESKLKKHLKLGAYRMNGAYFVGLVLTMNVLIVGVVACGDKKSKTSSPHSAEATSTSTSTFTSTASSTSENANSTTQAPVPSSSVPQAESVAPTTATSTGTSTTATSTADATTSALPLPLPIVTTPNEIPNGGAFLSVADFPASSFKLSASMISSFLSEEVLPYLPPYRDVQGETPTCLDPLQQIILTGDGLSLSYKIDQTVDCKNSSWPTYEISVKSVFNLTCTKNVFTNFIGKTLESLGNTPLIDICRDASVSHILNTTFTTKMATRDEPYTYLTKEMKVAVVSESGLPCDFTNSNGYLQIANSCKLYITTSEPDENDLSRFNRNTFIGSFKNAGGLSSYGYLSVGTLDFTLNTWSGSLNFSANQMLNYNMTNKNGNILQGRIQ